MRYVDGKSISYKIEQVNNEFIVRFNPLPLVHLYSIYRYNKDFTNRTLVQTINLENFNTRNRSVCGYKIYSTQSVFFTKDDYHIQYNKTYNLTTTNAISSSYYVYSMRSLDNITDNISSHENDIVSFVNKFPYDFANFQVYSPSSNVGRISGFVENEPDVCSFTIDNLNYLYVIQGVTVFDETQTVSSNLINLDGTAKIIFYNNTSEDIVVDKNLINETSLFIGSFRDSISITNPIFLIENDGVFEYNYCYIRSFNRYYYIDEIVNVRTNIWEIHCSVDTLMSFREDILKQNGIISRATYKDNTYVVPPTNIIDELVPLESKRTYGIQERIGTDGLYDQYGFYIVNLMAKSRDDDNIPPISNNCRPFVMNQYAFKEFVDNYQSYTPDNFLNISSIIVSVFWYPLNIDIFEDVAKSLISELETLDGSTIPFQNDESICYEIVEGDYILDFNKYPIEFNIQKMFNQDYDILNYTNTVIEFFSSLTGFIKLENYTLGNKLSLFIAIDLLTGSTLLNFKGEHGHLLSTSVNLGYSIGIGRTNFADIQRDLYSIQRDYKIGQVRIEKEVRSGAIETIAGGISGAFSPRKSLASKIVDPIASGLEVSSRALSDSTINDMVRLKNSRIAEQPEYTTSQPSGNLCEVMMFFRSFFIRYNFSKIIDNNFRRLVGVAVNEMGVLSDYSGYTVVNSIRLKDIPYALNSEKEQIKNYLQTGVILP